MLQYQKTIFGRVSNERQQHRFHSSPRDRYIIRLYNINRRDTCTVNNSHITQWRHLWRSLVIFFFFLYSQLPNPPARTPPSSIPRASTDTHTPLQATRGKNMSYYYYCSFCTEFSPRSRYFIMI